MTQRRSGVREVGKQPSRIPPAHKKRHETIDDETTIAAIDSSEQSQANRRSYVWMNCTRMQYSPCSSIDARPERHAGQ